MKKKIFAIIPITIFSIFLWIFISLSEDHFKSIELEFEVQDIPKGYAVASFSQRKLKASVKGRGWILAQLTFAQDPRFQVSAHLDSGYENIDLRTELDNNTWLSSNVQVLDLTPDRLEIDVEKIVSKEVPVVVQAEFGFKENYGSVSQLNIIPSEMNISGARSIVDTIRELKTVFEVFDGLEKNFERRLPLKQIPGIKSAMNEVILKFDVQKIVDRNFEKTPIEIRNVPRGYELLLYPAFVDVIVKGGIENLSMLDESKITPYVYFQQAYKDTLGFITPSVILPDNFTLVDIKPGRLDYIIKQY